MAAIAYDETNTAAGAAIAVRAGTSGERQRLSVAHELGHLTLKLEDEADAEKLAFRFAIAFLFPKPTLLQEIGRRRVRISLDELLLLKQRYGVSLQAILYALKDWEVITPACYTFWMRQIGRNGWRTAEPEALPEETSGRSTSCCCAQWQSVWCALRMRKNF
ncbi:MAG: ImmA/IrrE family metallo-endopeptidase [Fimbriimonadales bacterium]